MNALINKHGIWLLVAALLLAAARLIDFIGHQPLLAYANNYDMTRIQACHQIWPADPIFAPGQRTYEMPLEFYQQNSELELGDCFPSSALVFTGLLSSWIAEEQPFSIRRLALIKGGVSWLGIALLAMVAWRTNRAIALVIAGSAAVLLADPFNALYLAGFYTEWSALISLWFSMVLLYLALNSPASWWLSLALGLALVLLGLSRTQHMLLPALALVAAVLVLRRQRLSSYRWPLLSMLAAVALVVGLQNQWMNHDRNSGVRAANATNTFLYTVLASSDDPHRLATKLGLPRSCGDHAGKSWWAPGMEEQHPCPQVLEASRARLLLLPVLDVGAFLQLIETSGDYLQPTSPTFLGQVAGQELQQASDYRASVFSVFDAISSKMFVVIAVFLSALAAWLGLRICTDSTQLGVGATLLLAALAVPMTFFVSLLGDGFSDLARHNHLTYNLLWMLLIWIGLGCVLRLAQGTSRRGH